MKLEDLLLERKNYDKPRQHIKKQRHYFANIGPSSQSYGFSSSHVLMWELDYKESWALKNWCCWTVALEKTLESPLDSKEIKPVNPKGNQSWIFMEGLMLKLKLWPPDAKNWLIRKDLDAGQDWRQEEKGTTEDEMVGWHHWFDGHEFEQVSGVGNGQGSLVCCNPWGRKESDTTELLNWTEPPCIVDEPFFLHLLVFMSSETVDTLVFTAFCSHSRLWFCFSFKYDTHCPNTFLILQKKRKK